MGQTANQRVSISWIAVHPSLIDDSGFALVPDWTSLTGLFDSGFKTLLSNVVMELVLLLVFSCSFSSLGFAIFFLSGWNQGSKTAMA